MSAEFHYEAIEELLVKQHIPFDREAEESDYSDTAGYCSKYSNRSYRPATACGRKKRDVKRLLNQNGDCVIAIGALQKIADLRQPELVGKKFLAFMDHISPTLLQDWANGKYVPLSKTHK